MKSLKDICFFTLKDTGKIEFKSQVSILYNHVMDDGIGDLYHFIDIYHALKNKNFADHKLISIITCANRYEQAKKIIDEQCIENCYIFHIESSKEAIKIEPDLRQLIANSVQFISISRDQDSKFFLQYASPLIKRKEIYEHDVRQSSSSMGLRLGNAGLKLQSCERIPLSEFITMLSEKKDDFYRALTAIYPAARFPQQFEEEHILIPAYFSLGNTFVHFFDFILSNMSFHTSKNIIFYSSGCREFNISEYLFEEMKKTIDFVGKSKSAMMFEAQNQGLLKRLINHPSDIKCIQLIEKQDNGHAVTLNFIINPEGQRTVSVFQGFYLDNECHLKCYQQATIAGSSGDTSLELSISCKAFIFYLSTNHSQKCVTLAALADIIEMMPINLPEQIKADYLIYFREMASWTMLVDLDVRAPRAIRTGFSQLNLPEMIAHWPKVADYLIKNHNFYDKLENIFFEDILDLQFLSCDM
mgnify:CR=1 FL=1